MANPYVFCSGCSKRLQNKRRYPMEPLSRWLGLNMSRTCRAAKMSGTTEQAALCHGITRQVVDRIADELGFHPSEVWPEVVEHDIEDLSRECAAPDCTERFIPGRHPAHRFCSRVCRYRDQGRRKRAQPAYRQAEATRGRAWKTANIEEHREYQRRYQRRYMRLWRARKREEEAA